jgi:hypothetical protein
VGGIFTGAARTTLVIHFKLDANRGAVSNEVLFRVWGGLMNDLVRLAASRAVERFAGTGPNDGVFTSAGFSQELVSMSPTTDQIDGHIVRLILTGRPDVQVLGGGDHYRLVEST